MIFKEDSLISRATKFHKPALICIAEYAVNGVSGSKAIVGLDPKTDVRLWTATVNLIDCPPNPGCVWVDNNGLNKGLMDELIRLGVIAFNDRFTRIKTGYVFECRLLREPAKRA
jgi:hypothetical protein